MVTSQSRARDVVYPEQDGKVTESHRHYQQAHDLYATLSRFFEGKNRHDVLVAANIAFFYVEGNPSKFFSPDILIAFEARPRSEMGHGSYRLWEEAMSPAVVIELTSLSTRRVDTIQKPRAYERLGIKEYFLFDPLGEFLRPRLQGYQLTPTGYERLHGDELESQELGLRLVVRDGWLRLLDPQTGILLPTPAEEHAALLAAQAEIARLQAELNRQK